jgi:hypothetical protein
MVFVIAVSAVLFPIVVGLLLAVVSSRLDVIVEEAKVAVDEKGKGYNLALTAGHAIKTTGDTKAQLKEARLLAAKKAASLRRGSNMNIGRLGSSTLKTAWQGVDRDPMTAVKIANFHGWQGVTTGFVEAVAAAPVVAKAAAVTSGKIDLVPGKDYEYVEITDSMSPADKRKARIANSKAKSVAMKKAKAAASGGAPVPVQAAVAAPAAAAPAAVATAVSVSPPVLIDITDEMSPDETRKARIANSKAKSAYNKALKAAGIDPSTVQEGQVVQVAAPAAETAPAAAAPAPTADSTAAAGIPKPDLIEITDDMSPDDLRKARIANSKAKSAYNKALKAAGIDPSTVQK